jgi:hypothetical protein
VMLPEKDSVLEKPPHFDPNNILVCSYAALYAATYLLPNFMQEMLGHTAATSGMVFSNWPTPIPLVTKNNSWYFDIEAGSKEILFRRIGRNEISAIRVCQELVAAEKEYRSSQHDEYARKIFSDEGQRNGLYWKVANGKPQSPIGPLVASAIAEGYAKGQGCPPTPYRGYYFQMLRKQGKNAAGGAKYYIVHGKMTEGFAFLAYPADYRSSGVMIFIVNQNGVVLQKDFGKKTDILTKYNPDSSWQKADGQQGETAGEPSGKCQVGTPRPGFCGSVAM